MKLPLPVIILLGLGTILAFYSAIVVSDMIGEVNKHLPEDRQISDSWGYPGKIGDVKEHYKRLYPNGNLSRVLTILQAALVIIGATLALLIGLGSHKL